MVSSVLPTVSFRGAATQGATAGRRTEEDKEKGEGMPALNSEPEVPSHCTADLVQ